MEPRDPSNETLHFWDERNITASQVNWTMLEVTVRIKIIAKHLHTYIYMYMSKIMPDAEERPDLERNCSFSNET